MKNNQYIRQAQHKKGFAKIWIALGVVVTIIVGLVVVVTRGCFIQGQFYFHSRCVATGVIDPIINHFYWRGIDFDYSLSWKAEIIKYGSAAMQAEGKTEEVGFRVSKEGVGSIYAGGPQSGGDTCENLKPRRPYIKCADIKSGNRGETMAMTTSDNNSETLVVFNQILSTFKFIEPVAQLGLTKEIALQILKDDLFDPKCEGGEYKFCKVDITKVSSDWIVTVTYDGLYDDSVKAMKYETTITYQGGQWLKGNVFKTQQCQLNRGHQDFSSEPCL